MNNTATSTSSDTHNTLLTDEELKLYERQIQDENIGIAGQEKIKQSSVMISRVGGLGGSVAMLLAKAGIGKLVLAHDGVVEHENLNRMHLAFRKDLGQPRIDVFERTLNDINPDVEIVKTNENVNSDNADWLASQADIIVDAAPLFEERYLMNQSAVAQQKPLVMAGMYGLDGYVTTVKPGSSACLACIFPKPPEDWNLTIFPVITPSPVIISSIAAMEVLKLIVGIGDTLENKLLYCDLLTNTYKKLDVSKRHDCPVCGTPVEAEMAV